MSTGKPDSLIELGIFLREETVGHHRTACPNCNRTRPGDTALSVEIDDGGFIFLCHRCGWKGGSRGAVVAGTPRPPKPPRAVEPFWPTWNRSLVIRPGTVAAAYLEHRGCALPHPEGDLRFIAQERHPSGLGAPCMVGLLTDAVTCEPMTIARTWLARDGSAKADVERPRLLWKGAPKAGGVVRLWPDEEVTGGLAVAEGIEALNVVVDNDEAGHKAFNAVSLRWREAGATVYRHQPAKPGADFADIAAGVA